MDLNSLLASLASQNSGQQQQQTQSQETQNGNQQSLQDLLNSLKGLSSNTNSQSSTTPTSNTQPQSTQQTSSALSSLASLSSTNEQSYTPSFTTNNNQTNTENETPSLDNVLNSIKVFTSMQTNDDQYSTPSSQQPQSTNSVLSELASLSSEPSAHPQPSIPPPKTLIPPPKTIVPPPQPSSQYQPIVPPPQPSSQHQPMVPPPMTSNTPQLSSITVNQTQSTAIPSQLNTTESKAEAASSAIQSLFDSLKKHQNNNQSPSSTLNFANKSSTQQVTDFIKLDPLQITFPSFDFINSNSPETIRLEQGQTLQSALDRAVQYAVIEVPSGTYLEEIEINKPVTLKAVGGPVNLTGKGESDTLFSRASYFSIEGFNITQKQSQAGGAISISGGFVKIENCTIKSPLLSPITVHSNSKVYIESCQISDGHNPNISAEGDSFVLIKKSKVTNSQTFGVLSKGNSHVIIDSCQFFDIESNAVSSIENGSVYLKDSTISKIKNTGFETASSVKSYVENCTFSQIDAYGVCANAPGNEAIVHRCTFIGCGMAGIKSSNQAKIRTFHNMYKDIGSNVMLLANDKGVIQCEEDKFEGSCLAAIASFANGLIFGKDLVFDNISGSALLTYEKGQMQIDLATITKCQGPGIHFRDQSYAKLGRITFKEGANANLVISDGTTGEIFDCKFNQSSMIGAEISNTNNFTFTNCEFCDNKACGMSIHDNATPVFISCKIKSNGQIGVDINGSGCHPTFEQCEFSYHSEAGANCFSNSTPVFNHCTFSMNKKIGIGNKGANITVNDSIVTRNGLAGASVYDKGVLIFNRTTIESNDNYAGQAFSNGTVCKLFDCKVSNHLLSFVVSDGGKLRCKNTTFEKSQNPQFDVRSSGFLSLNSCDIGQTTSGNGIQVHEKGRIKMKKTKVHDQSKMGLLVGNLGIATISDHSIFENNGQTGVVCFEGSKTEITDSDFNNNGFMSIQAQGGELSVTNCHISNHKQCGIFASKSVKFNYSGNDFSNNGTKDIVVQ